MGAEDELKKKVEELEKQKKDLEKKVEGLTKTSTQVKQEEFESSDIFTAKSGEEGGGVSSTGSIMSAGLTDVRQFGQELSSALTGGGLKDVDYLIEKSKDLANNMGVGKARASEFRTLIADAVPEMVKLGMSEQEAFKAMEDIPATLKTNTTLTKEVVVEVGAASKISGKSAGELVGAFKNVGFNLDTIGNNMADVANYAKGVGVNVGAVTKGVVENLKYLNTMNFDGGVKGLAKMVAQSEMLGVNMGKVLAKADDLMDPEKAIDFSSALQRLGVQSSALLDPLSAMDMAMNDPAKLQDEMVKISKQFTRLKADGSGFEILPGAKLQMKEIAGTLGMSADELANMALKSSDLEMKMSKIKFPGFAASEEDKTLIANMAQMKDGRAMVTITDEKGQAKEVDVENLTAEQIEKLKEEQTNQNKSAEDIAKDQLSVLKEILAVQSGAKGAVRLGVASSGAIQRMTNTANEIRKEVNKSISDQVSTEGVRGKTGDVLGKVEEGLVEGIKTGDTEKITASFAELPGLLLNLPKDIGASVVDAMKQASTGVGFAIKNEYKEITGEKPVPGESNIVTQSIEKLETLFKDIFGKGEAAVKTTLGADINMNVTHTVTGQNVAASEDYKKYFESWAKNDLTKNESLLITIDKAMKDVVNKGK